MTASSTTPRHLSGAVREPVSSLAPALGRPPLLVWLVTALHAMLLVSHSVLVPTWRSPDETSHVDLVVALTEDGGYPAYDQRVMDPGIRASRELVEFSEGSRHLARSDATPRADRPSLRELREASPPPVVDRATGRGFNHMAQHPPAYYLYLAAGSVVTEAVAPGDGLGSYDREVGVLRLLSLLLIVPLPLLAWAAARSAAASGPTAVGAAVVPLAIPQLTNIGAGVNNDALLLALMGALTLLAVRFATGHVTRRGVVLAGVLTGLALLVKAFAFVAPVWLLVAIVWGCRRRGRGWGPLVGTYVGMALVTGGWWWLANLARYGSILPSLEYASRLRPADSSVERDVSGWLGDWLPHMSERFWGSFGWVEVPLPVPWTTAATAVVLVTVAAALVGRRRPLSRATAGVLLLPTLLLGVFVFVSGYRLYQLAGVAAMVQGRYLFGGVVGLSVLVAAGGSRLLGRRQALLPGLVLLAAAAMQLRAGTTLLDAFWGEEGTGIIDSLAAAGAWSPWPPWLLVGMAVVGAATVVATGVGTLRFARSAGVPPAD
ncbi:MAG: DUF2142 domain-containing protein [Actinobacteria bacterium]|nr:DUF2142 domain-containing protein [Actinomycetota bacterium]